MDRVQAPGGPVTARVLAVCALVAALFLMHGLPGAAAGGCPGGMAMTGPVRMAAVAPLPHANATAHPSHPRAGVAPRLTPTGAGGTLCVSTPPRGPVPLGAAGVAALAASGVWGLSGRRPAAGRVRRRGPPGGGGRALLTRVCVART